MFQSRPANVGRLMMDRDVRITRNITNWFVRQWKNRMNMGVIVMRVDRRSRERYRYR